MEEKGLAVAVHTRRLEDSEAAFDRLLPLITELAKSHDLDVEPGRRVIEVRAHGMHKGAAVRRLAEELGAKAFAFCGDDLGDVEAFKAVVELRGKGFPGLLVCSGASEQNAAGRPRRCRGGRPGRRARPAAWSSPPTSARPAPEPA